MNTDTREALSSDHLAQQRIDRSIARTPLGNPIPTATARLIAATIHHGPDTALGRYAASGQLDRRQAIEELSQTAINDLAPDWWLALDAHLRKEGSRERA